MSNNRYIRHYWCFKWWQRVSLECNTPGGRQNVFIGHQRQNVWISYSGQRILVCCRKKSQLFACILKRSRKQESKELLLSCLNDSTPRTIFFLQPSHHFLNYSFIKQRNPGMMKRSSICAATIRVCCRVFDVQQIWTWLYISLVD